MTEKIKNFIGEHISKETLIKVQGSPISSFKIKKVVWKPIQTKKGLQWQLIETHPTKDLTYTFPFEEGLEKLLNSIEKESKSMMIFTTEINWQIVYAKNGQLAIKSHEPLPHIQVDWAHNREKQHLIAADQAPYLHGLGLSNAQGKITKAGQDKFKQISHILALLQPILDGQQKQWNIADMGAGKGYLSFALYDYLQENGHEVNIQAIEMRPELVEQGNALSKKVGYKGLKFETNNIEQSVLADTNLVLALHACDTATDDAIIKGIENEVEHIVVAPCCHKELRRQWDIKAADPVNHFILKHNIYQERQAEMLTDAIRALLLEYAGYDTKVIDFISTEHTPKNVLIIASKRKNAVAIHPEKWTELSALKKLYGLGEYYLERKIKELK